MHRRQLLAPLEVLLDELVGELVEEVAAPVALQALRVEPVEQALQRGVRHRSDAVKQRRADVVHRREQLGRLLLGADNAPHHGADFAQMQLLREEIHRRHGHQREEAVDGLGGRGQEVAVEAHHLGCLLDWPERRPGHYGSADRVGAELERRDDAEIAAPTAQRPEQVGVLVGARVYLRAVGEDHVGPEQAVDREAEAPRQVADAAAERQPADAGRRDDPRRRRAAVFRRRLVDIGPGAAAADADGVGVRIDHDLAHPGQVDDDPVVDDAEAAAVVSAAAHGDRRVVGAREGDGAPTSSALEQRTITAGRRSIMPLWTARASS